METTRIASQDERRECQTVVVIQKSFTLSTAKDPVDNYYMISRFLKTLPIDVKPDFLLLLRGLVNAELE